MSVPRERFGEGITWDDWLERLGEHGRVWQQRFDQTALGTLRAEYQDVPTPRYVLCIFDPESAAAHEVVPVVARACDQAGVAGGVDLRLFPIDEFPEIGTQYVAEGMESSPVCVVFDDGWLQIGLWRLRADAARDTDWTRAALQGLLDALRGQPNRPWQGHRTHGQQHFKQADQAPGSA